MARYAARVTQEITEITGSNPVEMLSDRELAEETLLLLRSLDATLAKMVAAWTNGGVRGLRSAARESHGRR